MARTKQTQRKTEKRKREEVGGNENKEEKDKESEKKQKTYTNPDLIYDPATYRMPTMRVKNNPDDDREHAFTPLIRPPVIRRVLTNIPPALHNTSTPYSSGDLWTIIIQHFEPTTENMRSILNIQQICHRLSYAFSCLRDAIFWKNAYNEVFPVYSFKQIQRYGESWDSAFVPPKLSISSPRCWKNRLIHRMWLQQYRSVPHKKKHNLCKVVDGFTIPNEVILLSKPKTDPMRHIVLVGPSTLPIYFKVEYNTHYNGDDWCMQLSAFSFRAHKWKPFDRIFTCYSCDESEGERYPLHKTLESLVWGFKTADLKEDNWDDKIPGTDIAVFKIESSLRELLCDLGSVPEEQMNENTARSVALVDSDEEILE